MIAARPRHRRHQGPAAHVVTRAICVRCGRPFTLEGRRAWLAVHAQVQGVGAICDPCANRAASRAE